MSKKPFDKFINKPESGAKKKEKIRQEKKKARAEKNAWFDEQKKLAWERRNGKVTGERERTHGKRDKPQGSRDKDQGTRYRAPQGEKNKQQSVRGRIGIVRKNPESARENPVRENKVIQKGNTVYSPAVTSKSQTSNNKTPVAKVSPANTSAEQMPLNKFIAWSGVCGRREAADIIKAGKVTVNGKTVTEPPHRVSHEDNVKVNGKKISIQKNLVYILLNKPKDYITTTDDPEGRKTVMDLIKKATTERVFPVGRLDRNTTGVLLLTNDGELAQRLTHPKYEVKKIYEVKLDKAVTKQQLDTIATGITLEDGFIKPDMVAYADATDKSVIGIEIHSGRNRIVRRIFEQLGFDVKNLDRVMYGSFTKKNVERGKWRMLSEKEVRILKHLNTSFNNKKNSRS